MINTNRSTICTHCGEALSQLDPFCACVARQSFWQKTWSVFAPSGDSTDSLWHRRAMVAMYFVVTGWVAFLTALAPRRGFGMTKGDVGYFLVLTAAYALLAMGGAFVVPKLLPKSPAGRIIAGVVGFVATVPFWIYMLVPSAT